MTMMTATDRSVTGGVDTHADVHVAAAVDSQSHRMLGAASFPTTAKGYARLLEWLRSFGVVDRVGVESTGSWGAGLAQHLSAEGVEVVEVDRPDRKTRRMAGKSDPVDAEAAARAVLSGRATAQPKPHDGPAEAVRVLEVVHDSAVKDRTRAINQFKALVVTAPEPIRARLRDLTVTRQLERVRTVPSQPEDVVWEATRTGLRELARRIRALDDQVERIGKRLRPLVAEAAPALAGLKGVGPHVAAQLLAAAGDNPHRLASEAAFAKLCGACPMPASSGRTIRHRLNRGGDRRANRALYTIVLVRMRHDRRTRDYVARRTAEGKTTKEIIRCLKRYVAREVFQALTRPPEDVPTGSELRRLRQERGLTLTAVCIAMGTTPMRVSTLERELTHDTEMACRIRAWLLGRTD